MEFPSPKHIARYIDSRNINPKPLIWTASVRQILTEVNKANETLATLVYLCIAKLIWIVSQNVFFAAGRSLPTGLLSTSGDARHVICFSVILSPRKRTS